MKGRRAIWMRAGTTATPPRRTGQPDSDPRRAPRPRIWLIRMALTTAS